MHTRQKLLCWSCIYVCSILLLALELRMNKIYISIIIALQPVNKLSLQKISVNQLFL